MKYKILILGWKINSWKESNKSVQALTYNLYLAFKEIDNVEVFYCDKSEKDLPKVDFVIFSAYHSDKLNIKKIKSKTKARKICNLRETRTHVCDFHFLFNPEHKDKNSVLLPPPCNKKLLKLTKKEERSILIDHYWEDYLGTEKDWTYRIEDWLDTVKEDYKIYRMIRFDNEDKKIRKFETPIFYSDYLDYLDKTSFIENYIITHDEAFPYGVIDMAARGTRIMSPVGFLPNCLVNTFKVALFNDKDSFLKKLSVPLLEKIYNKQEKYCMDFNDIAKTIDNYFTKWIDD